MIYRFRALKAASLFFLMAAVVGVSCTPVNNTNTANGNNANGNANTAQTAQQSPLPQNIKDSEYAGFKEAGPDGNVSLSFTSPQENEAVTGNAVAPTFNVTGYPIYMD